MEEQFLDDGHTTMPLPPPLLPLKRGRSRKMQNQSQTILKNIHKGHDEWFFVLKRGELRFFSMAFF